MIRAWPWRAWTATLALRVAYCGVHPGLGKRYRCHHTSSKSSLVLATTIVPLHAVNLRCGTRLRCIKCTPTDHGFSTIHFRDQSSPRTVLDGFVV
ncbi:hypothetical protein PLICRDRAFT_368332 [Plicaturopsis crispa FD-325 SS-3]|uniref:Secreted protein n=1 Tax=Plicaturopsis crispa FD-325 SS-3 TaxID=944288 RepID=A0A0C9T7C2_PLICR|nr:hypothetical protein PLICRDRAFT_368332 [Plicaturopsis crispa FD-325 SS-3]